MLNFFRAAKKRSAGRNNFLIAVSFLPINVSVKGNGCVRALAVPGSFFQKNYFLKSRDSTRNFCGFPKHFALTKIIYVKITIDRRERRAGGEGFCS